MLQLGGKAVSQEGGNVSGVVGPASSVGPRKGSRSRKPNSRMSGPEWVQALASAVVASAV